LNNRLARLSPAVVLPLAAALVLAILAGPQTGAAIEALYAGDVGEFVGADVNGTPEQASRAAGILEAVDEHFGDAWARLRAGTLRVFLAYVVAPAADRRQLDRAAADLSSGLARAPALDAITWAALAQARLGLGDRSAAARALVVSMRLAPHEPRLGLWRAELGVAVNDQLDARQRQMWMRQVQLAWRVSQSAVLAVARRDPAAQALLTLAFASQPQMLREFEAALAER
jgi:hypothetical protein